jgi:DNA-binding transcriptional regulator YhcF (GntR family)
MISINNKISVPKYKQIINSIEELIISGNLKKGDQLISINKLRQEQNLSRDTVLMAFNDLKNRGIIKSVVGKGYYVSTETVRTTQKIFLLFDEFNSFKEDLYNSFLEHLGENIQVDIFFHHFNKNVFEKLISDNLGSYNFYVIMPANFKNTNQIIKILPKNKVYILDQIHNDLKEYAGIYQHFENVIYTNLIEVENLVFKYKHLILVDSANKQPIGLINGFTKFCKEKKLSHTVVTSLKDKTPEKGDLYIIPDDKNLLRIIKKSKQNKLKLAKDFGIISYNDTLLKELVEGGITTISTNFNTMGKRLAEMILKKEEKQIENPNQLILRNSI